MYNLSGCVFIKDTFRGAFCLFESMHQLLPLCDEFIVMDLGSTDGTLEILKEIEDCNPKVKVVQQSFPYQDAAVFATLANDLIAMCSYPSVLYYQSDEIWHEDLVELTRQALDEGKRDLSFWRVQLKYNFQYIKWYPHPVHRIGSKDNFVFENDGMNTNRTFDAKMVSSWGMEYFSQWGDKYKFNPVALPTDEMILDVSLTGAFLDNIPDRRRMHLPFWNEGDVMPSDEQGLSVDDWYKYQQGNKEWYSHSTKFNIPEIMKYHLGRSRYTLRSWLLEKLKAGEEWR
jgi:glycosyltransferase involved in cell wall biosynthesis